MSSKIYTSVLTALLLFSTSSVFAEVATTSSLRGVVNVAGAVVSATHTPTGTSKSRSASADGAFYLSDLQIGGPYDISVAAPGYKTESLGGVFLILNKTTDITVTLVSSDIEEITVTAAASEGSIRMGTGTFFDRDAIDGIPTVNRSIADIAKMDPRVSINTGSSRYSEISVMGANNRFNDFTIDGVSYNDPFGLNANGFGSMRNPIGMEFIDQISVDITPFDVSRGNTTGGSIASVTKSGTNEFHGSIGFIERDEDNIGDSPDGSEFPSFSEETTYFTLGGPIIKDRLFFFIGYEDFEAASPALYGTVDSNAPIKADTLTTAMAEEIKSIAMNRYGYDAGEISSVDYSPDGTIIATAAQDGSVDFWDIISGEKLTSLAGHSGWVWDVAFAPDGHVLASASADGTVKLWDLTSGREKTTLTGHTATVWSVAISADGNTVASGSWDGTSKLWDINSGQLLYTLSGHDDWVYDVEFSPSSQLLASTSRDGVLKLWDVDQGHHLWTSPASNTDSIMWNAAFSPNGEMIATTALTTGTSADGIVRVWGIPN